VAQINLASASKSHSIRVRTCGEHVRTSREETRTCEENFYVQESVSRGRVFSILSISRPFISSPEAHTRAFLTQKGSCVPAGKRCVPAGKEVRTSRDKSAYLRGKECVPPGINLRTCGEIENSFPLEIGRFCQLFAVSFVYVLFFVYMFCQQEQFSNKSLVRTSLG
jgi:hypothetical protein